MADSVEADLAVLRDFESQCESFKAKMDKGHKLLVDGINAAHAGWDDTGYDNVRKMVVAIGQEIESIEGMVSGQVLPYVQETISILDTPPY